MPSELACQAIPSMVPPGNITGYYYIPFANLPWHTSWQELKDHIRTVCSVERVEINDNNTGGHVVLKGRANFDAALGMVVQQHSCQSVWKSTNSTLELLNGGAFNDRALIADGRNADSWVLVMRHMDYPPPSPQSPMATSNATNSSQQPSVLLDNSSPVYSEVSWPSLSAELCIVACTCSHADT
ncbi:hypothetical protein F4777DRAFT_313182 [Nemania sp. FL0916]|nr:hypothetical protein F4777DRAFT_313182 [Nemania sp. FL0916]